MERQRLLKLIDNKGTSSKEETAELWDVVRTFPFFQTARLLLVKSFHNQESIHFHNELKVAAAYASDRKVLFNLINREKTMEKADEESNVFAIEQKQPEKEEPALKLNESYSDNQFALAEKSDEQLETPVFEMKEEAPSFNERKTAYITPETKNQKEVEEEQEEVVKEKKIIPEPLTTSSDEPATTNEEIIRRRLSEILGKNKSELQKEEKQETKQSVYAEEIPVSIETRTTEEEPKAIEILDELPSQPKDVIEGLEIETIIEENYLHELEKLPEIVKPVILAKEIQKETVISEPSQANAHLLSFIDWLKQKTAGETTLEEVLDEPVHFYYEKEEISNEAATQSSELINKFIATAPRIAPVKAEFYSPSNMARQSIIDNEDIISETLARIYFEQGNYPKARSCYERLSLLYPEKSASFAPLIEKINKLLLET